MQEGDNFKSSLQQFDELIAEIRKLEKINKVLIEGLTQISESNDPIGIAKATLNEQKRINQGE
jgi:hypothetical protein